ncbi:TIGR02270 family protein [Sorangium sp. So ce1014]|uniref:TIGR02270 family protein n=1 Tax=Sorangium sp. So ce1014 TaxID=3133326 RepID=UPI003F621B82
MRRILSDIVERHADEAAFLWHRRERAARSTLFNLRSLNELDARLTANLDGLVLAGVEGLQIAIAAFERATRDTEGPDGELFTASYVAAEIQDNLALAKLIAFAQHRPRHERALISALEWLEGRTAKRVISELLSNDCPPVLHRLGIDASAARREDPGAPLGRALGASDPELRASAYRAAGHLGRRDLLTALRLAARDPNDCGSPWAAWAAALLGDHGSVSVLWAAAETAHGDFRLPAADLAARIDEPRNAMAKISALSASEHTLPAALASAAARGDPSCIPWVLEIVARCPALARHGSSVYLTITGVKADAPLFQREPSRHPYEPELEYHLSDAGHELPAPVGGELEAHWAIARRHLREGVRYLGGHPLSPAWLRECLYAGLQPWRASAALELSLGSLDTRLFPVLAPGMTQKALLDEATCHRGEFLCTDG